MRKMSLNFKLIGGFAIVCVITAALGVVSYVALSQTDEAYDQTAGVAMPAMLGLVEEEVCLERAMGDLDALYNPFFKKEDYRGMLDDYDAAMKEYHEREAEYEKIPHQPEEEKLDAAYDAAFAAQEPLTAKLVETAKKLLTAETEKEKSAIFIEMDQIQTRDGQDAALQKAITALIDLQDWGHQYYTVDTKNAQDAQIVLLKNLVMIMAIASVIVALALGIIIARSINKPITKVSAELFTASRSLESASLQVSSSSQELSSGSSELASSIEEMTSSLEELQSIIEANTKNVNQSELLMQETSTEASKASDRMGELKAALVEISDNSRKIAKIIKVIDDIAFQTNILALNAAVEAARAGDAGKGFAVVAEQVKSLAQKSAEAAKETADLIERAIDSVAKGESLGNVAQEAQKSTVDKASKVSTLLNEVNRASKEQLKGANQITQGVSQVNSVVQGTAASSEENAAAGEELLSQAESLRTNVNQLNLIITGRAESAQQASSGGQRQGANAQNAARVHEASRAAQKNVVHARIGHDQGQGSVELTRPEDAIPLKDFKDF